MSNYTIPFNKTCVLGNEIGYMADAVNRGHISGDGVFTKKCHEFLQNELGVSKVLLTTSCTHALEIAALLLEIKPGDEVILPSFTFVSTVNAFVIRGAHPIFVDIRADTLNMNELLIEQLITPRTKAIIPVHYGGVGCEMDTILDLARQYDISVVEDNAHGLFGKYKGRNLGTFGCLCAQSFHETKNFSCGEGGALLINDSKYIERAEIIREKGTNRSRFYRGEVDKYTWVDVGSSYLPSDILAAFLYAQLTAKGKIQGKRQTIWEYYNAHLDGWAQENGVQLPFVPNYCASSFHIYYMIMPTLKIRNRMIRYLKERGILSVFHYLPLHLSKMGRKWGGEEGDCAVTEDLSNRIIRLPIYHELTYSAQDYIITTIKRF